jgi:hypothetical protein
VLPAVVGLSKLSLRGKLYQHRSLEIISLLPSCVPSLTHLAIAMVPKNRNYYDGLGSDEMMKAMSHLLQLKQLRQVALGIAMMTISDATVDYEHFMKDRPSLLGIDAASSSTDETIQPSTTESKTPPAASTSSTTESEVIALQTQKIRASLMSLTQLCDILKELHIHDMPNLTNEWLTYLLSLHSLDHLRIDMVHDIHPRNSSHLPKVYQIPVNDVIHHRWPSLRSLFIRPSSSPSLLSTNVSLSSTVELLSLSSTLLPSPAAKPRATFNFS